MEVDKILDTINQTSEAVADGEKYIVLSIEGMKHKIGKSSEGFPKVFVVSKTSNSYMHNLNAELISAEYGIQCSLVDETNEYTEALCSIITLRSDDESLKKIFFDVFLMMLRTLPELPTDLELASKIEGLLSVFASLKRKPIHKIQGLWAELLVIEQSQNPEILAKAWHCLPGAKYDFTKGADKIEVKSTSSEERIHHFSLDQLNPSVSSQLLVASVNVRESSKDDNGLSIYNLYSKICSRVINIETRMHVYTVIASTLGEEYKKAESVYFDYVAGKDSLAFYDYHDIPKIEKQFVPPFVSGVKFSSNLSNIDDVSKKNIAFDESSLFSSI